MGVSLPDCWRLILFGVQRAPRDAGATEGDGIARVVMWHNKQKEAYGKLMLARLHVQVLDNRSISPSPEVALARLRFAVPGHGPELRAILGPPGGGYRKLNDFKFSSRFDFRSNRPLL